jgi:hypothetical protein
MKQEIPKDLKFFLKQAQPVFAAMFQFLSCFS